jgi:hypothetical protein
MRFLTRFLFVAGGLAGVLAVTLGAGVRQGLLTLLGIGFGAVSASPPAGATTSSAATRRGCGRRCCCWRWRRR